MNDLGKALLAKLDNIIETWVKAVRVDVEIDSSKGLTFEAVHDGLPEVLKSVATLLTDAFSDEAQEIREEALEHGHVRANQGFDLAEIVREYRILRNVLVMALEPELTTGTVPEVIEAIRKIDSVLDDTVLITLESYMEHRFSLLKQMHGQLLLTNQELIRLIQNQKDDVSHLAHELKNPLNAIINFSSILLNKQKKHLHENVGTSLEIRQMERIVSNGRQILQLINNTLEVSRQESSKAALSIAKVEVIPLIQTVVDSLEPSATAKDLDLIIECSQVPQEIYTDSLRLQQILTNLLSNAIRYTDAGSVTVNGYKVDEQQWAIAIKDTGRGIKEEDQPKVFEPYFQVEEKEEKLPGSSGLGLSIVNKLVQMLHGKIELTSEVAQGSTFVVVLPIKVS
ncbi:ATPase, histidine kinase-, DNA gyrase B-, and HSP90-like domain protein [Synechococcus sp. PCC 7335]|uniref:sensor histidine kinase n=1 Tax=Synechococcus sp. (strain ATCC 29403 / PCC 7335) TaxID=91464 RepID=UPI00017EB0C7|nr:sensor histidine kinase [Synechococcus sp. PCC 7335]EDX87621.1 ATPase, histidine kinase-, DNA gyrase B-, and HSP90-like domain protein [Synechococcus sp. PCC 7335]